MPGVTSVGALVESHGVDRMGDGTLSRGDKNKLAVHAVRKRLATLLPVSNVPRRTQQLCSLRRPPRSTRGCRSRGHARMCGEKESVYYMRTRNSISSYGIGLPFSTDRAY